MCTVYASVECDSVSVILCSGVRVICSFCVEIEHTKRQHSWETEEEKHTNRMNNRDNNCVLHLSCTRKPPFPLGRRSI